jgi:hypothetical protein
MRDADPLSLEASGALQIVLRSSGQSAAADSEYERSKNLAGEHGEWDWYALLRLWSRKDADPTEVARRVRDILRTPNSELKQLESKLDDPPGARAVLREAFKGSRVRDSWTGVTGLALMADHFGDRDLVLAALRRRVELIDFHYIAWWPYETQLRSDPRFKQIVRDLKLDEYWRSSGNWGDFCKPLGESDFECR